MNHIKYILFSAALMLSNTSAQAQLLNVKLGSDALVEDAVKEAIVVVEPNYCIQDVETNEKYGRNGKSYFNVLQFVGCKTDKGVIMGESVICPWTVDKHFDKYKKGGKYRPLLDNNLVVKSSASDKADTLNVESHLTYNNDSTLVCVSSGCENIDGLNISDENKQTLNWLVWLKNTSDKEIEEPSDLGCTIVKKNIESTTGQMVVEAPIDSKAYLGGLYVSSKVIGMGLVEFSVSGFIVKKDGKWMVKLIDGETFSVKATDAEKEIAAPEPGDTDEDLTPVTPAKERKKKTKASKKK